MADYDVTALALASPPPSTPPATYTPAISVRNNGLHDAIASGWLSFYRKTTGVLVAQFNVTSGTIHPGSTGTATADGTLDLSTEVVGTQYIVTGYVTTTNDQVESNNPLAPVIITISAEPPPPPPPIAAHVTQHEAGGGDTLSVEGLTGELADAQTAKAHAAEHEETGSDELNVAGLHGELADGQTPKAHASSHEPGGADELAGIPAADHGNEKHTSVFLTADDVPTPQPATRQTPRIFEADDGTQGMYVSSQTRPNVAGMLRQNWADGTQLYNGAAYELLHSLSYPENRQRPFSLRFHIAARVTGNQSLNASLSISLSGTSGTIYALQKDFTITANSDGDAVIANAVIVLDPFTELGVEFLHAAADGFILYPAGPTIPNQLRQAVYLPSISQSDSVLDMSVYMRVDNGDSENLCAVVSAYIEGLPAEDPPD